MINNEFLKTLTILYVEDEDLAREKLAQVLQRFFKKVIVAPNGEEGYKIFQKEMLTQNIDLILSDINMPKMNGIEMLEKIRETNSEVPIIYTTARTESEYLLKAIELNASHYILKPIDIEETIKRVEEVCEKKYYQRLVKQKNIELEQYSSILDNVAGVFKLNSQKEFTLINSLLLENFKEEENRVIGKKINALFHRDVSNSLIDEIWEVVKKGSSWHGNLKFTDSQNNIFYLNTTVFQIISDEGFEYVGIGFISTEEVEEKRDFHKKVIEQIKNTKIESSQVKNEIVNQKQHIEKLTSTLIHLQKQLKDEKEKRIGKVNQLNFFEKEIANTNERIENILSMKNKEIDGFKLNIESLRKDIVLLNNSCKDLQKQLISAHDEIEKLENIIKIKEEKVLRVSDLLEHRESQIRKINPELLS